MIYIESLTQFPCLVRKPANLKPQVNYPIVIGLHGGGNTPESIISLWDKVGDLEFMYVAPQAPFPMNSGNAVVFDWGNWPTGNTKLIEKSLKISENYIVDVIEKISEQFNSKDIYLLGWSQGAIMTYLVGIKHSHLLKGLICMSGPGLLSPLANPFGEPSSPDWLPEKDIAGASKLKVFITHGSKDELATIDLGRKSADILKNHNHNVIYREFDGDHKYPPKSIIQEIIEWL